MRHPIRALVVSALAVSLAAAGCSRNEGSSSNEREEQKPANVILDTKGEAKGPAAEVEGAKKGGTINVFQDGDFEHLDPAGVYVSNAGAVTAQLIYRTLTNFVESPTGGDQRLVGDLATNSGVSSEGGKVWTYTLRDGIKFEDGTPITSADVAYGIARAFSDFGADGPQYMQGYLGDGKYKGPYNGGAKVPPGVTLPDAKTIVFTMKDPHPDFPFVASLVTSAPVPAAKDTLDDYDTKFISSGPYKLAPNGYVPQKSMTLVRNENWDPATDPIRHQYPESYKWDFTQNAETVTQRLLADSGNDQTGIQVGAVPPQLVATVKGTSGIESRLVDKPTQYSWYNAINTQRITDVDVRRAIIYAHDKDAVIKALGGSTAGSPSTTTIAPTQPGYRKFDVYKAPLTGDVAKAKELLKGKTIPPIQYCFANTAVRQKAAATVKIALERAGFKVALNPIDRSAYYTTIGRKDTTCDMMIAGWGADFPDSSTVIPPLYDGTGIRPTGNQNYSYLNDAGVNAKIKALASEPDRQKANAAYADLDEQIQKDLAPIVPLYYDQNYTLIGSKVGGSYLTPNWGQASFLNLYVK